MDNPGQSPRVPIFCGTTDLPEMFKICGNHRYRLDSALWHYRPANKLATVRWMPTYEEYLYRCWLESNDPMLLEFSSIPNSCGT